MSVAGHIRFNCPSPRPNAHCHQGISRICAYMSSNSWTR
ncbi:Uncharacterised protein [Bordetella pertussis]|nr:Uncharacterised protein [Bordetella pertussis]